MVRLALAALSVLLAACAAGGTRPLCEPGRPCATASEAACAHGPEAELYGRAAFADGTCVAASDASCRAARLTCAHFGQCSAPTAPRTSTGCPAEADRDFLASRDPACAVGTCLATSDADCRAARVCALEGRCTAKDGVCVATTPAACRASAHCAALGACALTPAGTCRAASVADCAAARACKDFGDCGFANGACVACAKSAGCKAEGLCEKVGAACRATDTQHCRASEACREAGRCRAFQGACTK